MKHPVKMTKEEWAQFYPIEYEPETRTCDEGCSHYDTLNQCCWIVSGRGLFTEVEIGALCRYGYKEGSNE